MEPKIRCKACGCIWEYSELSERGDDGFFKCPKCGESLYNAPIENQVDLMIDDRPDPADDFNLEMPLSELWIKPMRLWDLDKHMEYVKNDQ